MNLSSSLHRDASVAWAFGSMAIKKLVLDLRDGSLEELVEAVPDPLAVTDLAFESSWTITDVRPIGVFRNLIRLDLDGSKQETLDGLQGLSGLLGLYLSECIQLHDLNGLQGLSALQHLDLSGCKLLRDLNGLQGLSGLQRLNVAGCEQLRDLDGLQGLSGLQRLHLSNCKQLRHLHGLQGLSGLRSLGLSGCRQLSDLDGLQGLSGLERLNLTSCPDIETVGREAWQCELAVRSLAADRLPGVPREILSRDSNVAPRLREWWQAMCDGEATEREIKLYFLGNSRAGKSQICNRLLGKPFVEGSVSTHGVDLGRVQLLPQGDDHPAVSGRLWDFGGQEIYHGTHALFLDSRAVFVLVWQPELDVDEEYDEDGVTMRHRPLRYWLDFVRSVADADAPLIVVHAQVDRFEQPYGRRELDDDGFGHLEQTWCSAKNDDLRRLRLALEDAARELLRREVPARLPWSWVDVRDQLRAEQVGAKTMSIERYHALCGARGVLAPDAVLHWLDRAGEVMHRPGLFGDEIVLDVQWALKAVYALFDRHRPAFQDLAEREGRFDLTWLDRFAWGGMYSSGEQRLFLRLMERCAIAFEIGMNSGRYVAMDAMPVATSRAVDETLRARLFGRGTLVRRRYAYVVLHEGVLRRLLCALGRMIGSDEILWRYGAAFCVLEHGLWALVRTERLSGPDSEGTGPSSDWAGSIVVEVTGDAASGPAANALAKALETLVLESGIGERPVIMVEKGPQELPAAWPDEFAPGEEADETRRGPLIGARPVPPYEVWISYAWGDDETDPGRLRSAVFDAVRRGLEDRGYRVEYDRKPENQHLGADIEEVANKIRLAERIVAIVSDKYLKSEWCMKEQVYTWRYHNYGFDEVLRRMKIVRLEDAPLHIGDYRRVLIEHWGTHCQAIDGSPGYGEDDRHTFDDVLRGLPGWLNKVQKTVAPVVEMPFDPARSEPLKLLWDAFPPPNKDA